MILLHVEMGNAAMNYASLLSSEARACKGSVTEAGAAILVFNGTFFPVERKIPRGAEYRLYGFTVFTLPRKPRKGRKARKAYKTVRTVR